MKNCLFLLLFLFPMCLFGQVNDVVSRNVLLKVSSFDASEMKIEHIEEIKVSDPSLPQPMNYGDSIAFDNQKITIQKKYVRFDKADIAQLFPQTVTVDANENIEIDYTSFIPILLQAIKEQQDLIEKLEARIESLEMSIEK